MSVASAPIKILSEETINKIAAGEVIERPANVVKEVVENSLDAGSTKIELEIKGAGRQLIRISDNGTGMTRQDLTLAVTRHATSKLSAFSDLERLTTMGFRGEALPSIAAVSHLSIKSQIKSQSSGWKIVLVGGKIKESRAWAGASGTIVEISRLFFNTPARAKFLKSDFTERHHIMRIIEEISLSNPEISFKVTLEGKTVLNVPASKTHIERLIDILGQEFAKNLVPVEVNRPAVNMKAFVTKVENSMPNRSHQFLFVNNRPVQFSKALTYSLYEAYRERLQSRRHPGAVIFLDVDPGQIDVNIHPTKREIRFSKENEIKQLLYKAIKDAIVQPINISLSTEEEPQPSLKAGYVSEQFRKASSPTRSYTSYENKPSSYSRYTTKVSESTTAYTANLPKPSSAVEQDAQELISLNKESSIRPLGQIFGMYIIAQDKNKLLIIDQHAAAERIRYERYLTEWENKKIPVQPLLIPITLEIPPSQLGLVRENNNLLNELGWEIGEFGKNTIRITAQPNVLGIDSDIKDIINEIIQSLTQDTKLPLSEKRDKIIRAACRASIKANESISLGEINQILRDLFLCKSPYTCPHGRPTLIELSKSELRKKFKRN